jgi:HEAT repeat protein
MSAPLTDAALLVELAKAYALSEFYPLKHPTLVQAILKLEGDLLARGSDLHLDVLPGGIAVDGAIPARRSPHVRRFAQQLDEQGVRALTLRHEIGSEALGRFLSCCALKPKVVSAAGGLAAALASGGAARLAVNGQWITAPRAVAIQDSEYAARALEEDGVALWSTHDMYQQVQISALRVEHENADELRRMLREGSEAERIEALQRLEYFAQFCLTHNDLDRTITVMDQLRADAEAMRGHNPSTRSNVMLALHRLANHAILAELVGRLGRSRTEEERAALRSLLVHLGADAVTPLVRELTAATDLSARRAFRDTLVALDQVGVPLLEDMMGDNRWFVVRNMVGILGEIRSADAVDHFSLTIAHHDPRVRRETVLALGKLGGEETVPLLVKALADHEPNLRAAAAMMLGLTRHGAAVSALLARLPVETDLEATLETVRALGRIGDARAVPALAERAAPGGLFSRVPTPVRLEAVRALAEINNDAARAVLQRLQRDRSAEVREAVFKIAADAIETPMLPAE